MINTLNNSTLHELAAEVITHREVLLDKELSFWKVFQVRIISDTRSNGNQIVQELSSLHKVSRKLLHAGVERRILKTRELDEFLVQFEHKIDNAFFFVDELEDSFGLLAELDLSTFSKTIK